MLQSLCGFPPVLSCFLLPYNSLMTLPTADTLASGKKQAQAAFHTKTKAAGDDMPAACLGHVHVARDVMMCQQTLR